LVSETAQESNKWMAGRDGLGIGGGALAMLKLWECLVVPWQ
jgi:hypothetical protein